MVGERAHLEQDVGRVVERHHDGAHADVVGDPRECQQSQRSDVVDHLLFKVLHQRERRQMKRAMNWDLNPAVYEMKNSRRRCL